MRDRLGVTKPVAVVGGLIVVILLITLVYSMTSGVLERGVSEIIQLSKSGPTVS